MAAMPPHPRYDMYLEGRTPTPQLLQSDGLRDVWWRLSAGTAQHTHAAKRVAALLTQLTTRHADVAVSLQPELGEIAERLASDALPAIGVMWSAWDHPVPDDFTGVRKTVHTEIVVPDQEDLALNDVEAYQVHSFGINEVKASVVYGISYRTTSAADRLMPELTLVQECQLTLACRKMRPDASSTAKWHLSVQLDAVRLLPSASPDRPRTLQRVQLQQVTVMPNANNAHLNHAMNRLWRKSEFEALMMLHQPQQQQHQERALARMNSVELLQDEEGTWLRKTLRPRDTEDSEQQEEEQQTVHMCSGGQIAKITEVLITGEEETKHTTHIVLLRVGPKYPGGDESAEPVWQEVHAQMMFEKHMQTLAVLNVWLGNHTSGQIVLECTKLQDMRYLWAQLHRKWEADGGLQLTQISSFGLQKSAPVGMDTDSRIWVYGNGALDASESVLRSEGAARWLTLSQVGMKLNKQTVTATHMDGGMGYPSANDVPMFCETKLTASDVLQNFKAVWNALRVRCEADRFVSQGLVAACIVLGLNWDFFARATSNFPILIAQGEAGCGKTTLAKTALSFFCRNPEKQIIGQGSEALISRRMDELPNMLLVCDDPQKNLDQMFKRVGSGTARQTCAGASACNAAILITLNDTQSRIMGTQASAVDKQACADRVIYMPMQKATQAHIMQHMANGTNPDDTLKQHLPTNSQLTRYMLAVRPTEQGLHTSTQLLLKLAMHYYEQQDSTRQLHLHSEVFYCDLLMRSLVRPTEQEWLEFFMWVANERYQMQTLISTTGGPGERFLRDLMHDMYTHAPTPNRESIWLHNVIVYDALPNALQTMQAPGGHLATVKVIKVWVPGACSVLSAHNHAHNPKQVTQALKRLGATQHKARFWDTSHGVPKLNENREPMTLADNYHDLLPGLTQRHDCVLMRMSIVEAIAQSDDLPTTGAMTLQQIEQIPEVQAVLKGESAVQQALFDTQLGEAAGYSRTVPLQQQQLCALHGFVMPCVQCSGVADAQRSKYPETREFAVLTHSPDTEMQGEPPGNQLALPSMQLYGFPASWDPETQEWSGEWLVDPDDCAAEAPAQL